eukprot:XP_019929078.1 PREDICTED: uncharacterized protein LOC109620663 [Crassostrea gigas]
MAETLSVTKEQKEAIEKPFEDNKWELTYQIIDGKRKTKSRKVHVRQAEQFCSSSYEETNRTEEPSTSSSGENTVCPYCFLSPCVATTNENSPCLGEGQGPSNYNPSVRKGLDRRFWKH